MTKLLNHLSILIIPIIFLCSITYGQSKDPSRELKRLNAKIDRVRVMVDSLELDNQILLPELMSAFKQAVKSKAQQDSITLVILKRINTLSNKIANLENQSNVLDSAALEIRNDLLMLDNKLVTMTKTYNEMYNAQVKEDNTSSPRNKVNDVEYRQIYTKGMGALQSNEIDIAIKNFSYLVELDANHDLADNAQYWLGECYYSGKEYLEAIKEFQKVFGFPNTNKGSDAQYKIALSYQSLGLIDKAKDEFQRLIDYHPGSEYYPKAKEALKQLSIN